MAATQEESTSLKEQFGRDELNICEFPITLLTDRPPDGIRTVTYTDRIPDRSTGETVNRKVTVTGSDLYGLTTATDADVLIALIQHTRMTNNFSAPRVPFTRYELIKILRWNREGYSYKRIAQSLRRWSGITIYFDKSWRDKTRRRWSSHSMSILSDVTINSSIGRREKGTPDDQNCWYTWGDKMFESLQAGNLKRLDLDVYFSLNSAIAKFMYRYLDKHFYRKPHLRLDLLTFAHEKLGMSRKYKISQVKNKLQSSIQELVSADFIESDGDRYERTEDGQWLINFVRRQIPTFDQVPPEEILGVSALRLVDYGVTKRVAIELASKYSEEEITKQIKAMLWKKSKTPELVKDQAAYLVAAIDQNWEVPNGFIEYKEIEEKKANQQVTEDRRNHQKHIERMNELKEKEFWDSMDKEAKQKFDEEAIKTLPGEQQEDLRSKKPTDPVYKLLVIAARQNLIRAKLDLPQI